MAKVPKGKEFEKVPEGNHASVCTGVWDLGTQQTEFDGKPKKVRQIRIQQQCVDLRTEEGENMCIHADYTFSEFSKNLGKIVKSWTGLALANMDPATLLLRPGFTTVTHQESKKTGKTYANIEAITMPPKGVKVGKATEPASSFFFDYVEDEEGFPIPESVTFDIEDFKAVPDWVKKKIVASDEYPIALTNNENGGWENPNAKSKSKKPAAKTVSAPAKTRGKK